MGGGLESLEAGEVAGEQPTTGATGVGDAGGGLDLAWGRDRSRGRTLGGTLHGFCSVSCWGRERSMGEDASGRVGGRGEKGAGGLFSGNCG